MYMTVVDASSAVQAICAVVMAWVAIKSTRRVVAPTPTDAAPNKRLIIVRYGMEIVLSIFILFSVFIWIAFPVADKHFVFSVAANFFCLISTMTIMVMRSLFGAILELKRIVLALGNAHNEAIKARQA